MKAIADTSPLNYLILIECVDILPLLYSEVAIPLEVLAELQADDAPASVRLWANSLPSWATVLTADPALRDDIKLRSLDLGERASIARDQGLRISRTLGVLDEAARRGLLFLPEVIYRLKQTTFRYPKNVVERLLAEDALRRTGQ